MKKLFAAAVLAMLCVFAVSAADDVDLTAPASQIRFPDDWVLGSWYDAKWDATWTIGNNDIKIYKGSELVVSFADKVQNYTVKAGVSGLVISFDCAATNRSYSITKPISLSTDLNLVVDRKDVPASDKNKHWETAIKYKK
ncbi:MAG: hypothetical protein HUK25_05015 [Treponema sp.]|nr:hypothetical protein [Treponema sp.]